MDDFWRMIWERRTLVIVAVVEMVPRGTDTEVTAYWGSKEGDTKQFWDLSITTVGVEDRIEFIVSKLVVTNLKV
jgi:protein tyrosine phosphatase